MANIPCVKEGGGNLLPLTLTLGNFWCGGDGMSANVLDFTVFKNMGYKNVKVGSWSGQNCGYNLAANTKYSLSAVSNLSYSGSVAYGRVDLWCAAVTLTFTVD